MKHAAVTLFFLYLQVWTTTGSLPQLVWQDTGGHHVQKIKRDNAKLALTVHREYNFSVTMYAKRKVYMYQNNFPGNV